MHVLTTGSTVPLGAALCEVRLADYDRGTALSRSEARRRAGPP